MTRADRLTQALRRPKHGVGALVAYVVAGYPTRGEFPDVLAAAAEVADAVEVGVPFTDPMADGVSIQRAASVALEQGVDLDWILEVIRDCPVPTALMGYLNPFLARGPTLVDDLESAGVAALVVPDLPLEERDVLGDAPLVQLVTPLTDEARLGALCDATAGFVYAVTALGTTGGRTDVGAASAALDRVRRRARHPVLAGFGIRTADQVRAACRHADGVIVGTALVDAIARGDDPARFLEQLMAA